MIVVNNRITSLDGMIISAIKDIQSEKVVLKNIAFDRVVTIEDMHGNMFEKQPEIIRCKDCKHYKAKQGNLPWKNSRRYCNKGVTLATNPDDFCSFAERRTDG